MAIFESRYDLGEQVSIDGALDGRVVAVRFYSDYPEYLIAWFSNGDAKSEWFLHWRVKAVEK